MSKQLEAQLLSAAIEVRDAIREPGKNPQYHLAQSAKLRGDWPTRWRGLDKLVAVVETLQKQVPQETGRSSGW